MELTTFQQVLKELQDAGIRYLLVGGMAVVAHGYGRMTFDIDLVVQLDPANIQKFFSALQRLGYAPRVPVTAADFGDPERRARWIADKGMVVLNFYSDHHRETAIDVFVEEPFDFDEIFARSEVGELEDISFHFVDLVTLIEMKEAAGRPQDLIDVSKLRLLAEDDCETDTP